jgi:hypothetical protein
LRERRFTSEAVEETIRNVKRDIADPEIAWMFENCFPNTLDTTVTSATRGGKPDTFVITGDIPAMWLRDSSAQVWPYLSLIKDDPKLRLLIEGAIRRQTSCILIDPYANAFHREPQRSEWADDRTRMTPELHERKWEIDSLCYPVRLAHRFWELTDDTDIFDERWRQAARAIVRTFREQQRKHDRGPYSFQRVTAVATDTLPLEGYGNPGRPVGLIHSAFRPSDDACIYPFLIPSNMFAVVALRLLHEIASRAIGDQELARDSRALAEEVDVALARHAPSRHPVSGEIYAYEVDGYGNVLFMDDANVPSLLSIPYLGYCAPDDPLYQKTRKFVLGDDNPYFYRGSLAEGIGGPHVGTDMIWPLSIIMRGLTSTDDREIAACLRMLKLTHAGTGFIHEGVHKNDPSRFTRPWFAWANTLFGEFVLKLHRERPHLLHGS